MWNLSPKRQFIFIWLYKWGIEGLQKTILPNGMQWNKCKSVKSNGLWCSCLPPRCKYSRGLNFQSLNFSKGKIPRRYLWQVFYCLVSLWIGPLKSQKTRPTQLHKKSTIKICAPDRPLCSSTSPITPPNPSSFHKHKGKKGMGTGLTSSHPEAISASSEGDCFHSINFNGAVKASNFIIPCSRNSAFFSLTESFSNVLYLFFYCTDY